MWVNRQAKLCNTFVYIIYYFNETNADFNHAGFGNLN